MLKWLFGILLMLSVVSAYSIANTTISTPAIVNTSVNCNAIPLMEASPVNYNITWEYYDNFIMVSGGVKAVDTSQNNTLVVLGNYTPTTAGDVLLCQAKITNGTSYSSFRVSPTVLVQVSSSSITVYPIPSLITIFWNSWGNMIIGIFVFGMAYILLVDLYASMIVAGILCFVAWLVMGGTTLLAFSILSLGAGVVTKYALSGQTQ